jgi:hypothetical protein
MIVGSSRDAAPAADGPSRAVTREWATMIEVSGNGLEAHRAEYPVPLLDKSIDPPRSLGAQPVDCRFSVTLCTHESAATARCELKLTRSQI